MRATNYALSPEGQGAKEAIDYAVVNSPAKHFDARQNLIDVMHAAASGSINDDRLLYEAASALQRQERAKEAPEQWAERLSQTFFAGLDDKS